MGTDKVIFVGEQWGATGSHMTGSRVTGPCPEPEECYAHEQPEVLQYP